MNIAGIIVVLISTLIFALGIFSLNRIHDDEGLISKLVAGITLLSVAQMLIGIHFLLYLS